MGVPHFPRMFLGAVVQRIAGQMLNLALVLFVLERFDSPSLAGTTVFTLIMPGLLVSPVAGALLDRYGRVRLMLLDYTVAALAIGLIVVLSLTGSLSPLTLLPIVGVASLTSILTIAGFRSLFPLVVPPALWDRVNGLDSAIYAVVAIVGPPLAAIIVSVSGGEVALLVTAAAFAIAALIMVGVPEPPTGLQQRGRLMRQAWEGLVYVLRHPTLRALGISISLINLGTGGLVVSVPVLILDRIHADTAAVGPVFAAYGVAGLLSALAVGRLGSRGREQLMLVSTMVITGIGLLGMAAVTSLWQVYAIAIFIGFTTGAQDIALFGIRQRRTDPALFGRAFAVSMSLNYMGAPFGSALTGVLVSQSIPLAFIVGAGFSAVAAVVTAVMIPSR